MDTDPPIGDIALVASFPTPAVRTGNNSAVPWYGDYSNIVRLARHLKDAGDDAETIIYFLEKPWKYTQEWEALLRLEAAGR